jgi:putative sterol carrier protein
MNTQVQVIVKGAPGGDRKCVLTFAGDELTGAEDGVLADAPLTITVTPADADALLARELDPSVAFMQGRLKTEGDTGVLLALLPVTRTARYDDWLEKLS